MLIHIVGTIKRENKRNHGEWVSINGKQEQDDPRGTKTAMIYV